MIFSSFGYKVQLYDVNLECLKKAPEMIAQELKDLCDKKLARGYLTLDERTSCISITESLEECLRDAVHVQECVFDSLPLKQELFEKVDQLLGDNTKAAICSSTSIHLPSLVFSKMDKHKDQCLVAHPINPPLHVRLVEMIPLATTREEILSRTRDLLSKVGQKPVLLRKEVSGFALNRLQYAVFQEAFRLIADGVMTPEDVDTVVSDGLGPRYAFMGPWMTAHLNAAGMGEYLEKYSEGIYNVSKDCQPLLKIEGDAAKQIVDAMTGQVPIDKLPDKRAWRDKCLVELARVKDSIGDI